ncbi:CWF19-like protein 2 homolog [Phlebotomus papatasi]|uniref:CWF19-like protein 2 homolog n=1 Tax=Phlebotomus papatasi TaxID=29031 RepID=UPI0024842576|nr:CWF19-like protein 2 homolog [Phlebotomus papatasi]
MSFIDFESAAEKEKIRQELRSVREKLLEKAEFNAKRRDEIAAHRKINQWMLPSVSEKIEKSQAMSKPKKQKKQKKEKKSKKEKSKKKSKKKKKRKSSSDDDSSDSVEVIPKKSHRKESSSSTSSSEDEWVEKGSCAKADDKPAVRDEWMSSGFLLPTFRKEETSTKNEKSTYEAYDPSKSSRELNPHWKDGGSGLPSAFMKPSEDFMSPSVSSSHFSSAKRQKWKKIPETKVSKDKSPSSGSESSSSESEKSPERQSKSPSRQEKAEANDFLSDVQINELGAKMIKAEIMGNSELAAELKMKLEKAKACRENVKDQVISQRNQKPEKKDTEEVILSATDSRGVTRPVSFKEDSDLWGGRRGSKKKRPKVETHTETGERARFFPDDDRRSLREMFEAEKLVSVSDSDAQYAKIAGKKRRQGDDLEDIFAEEVRRDLGDDEKSARDRDRAIRDHERLSRTLETCEMCFDSAKMAKELIVAMGSKVYLSLPWHEALQTGHCIISPIQHVSCSTQLDEEVWREVQDFQTTLIRMFSAQKKDCVFYEIANKLHRRPHLTIHCVPSTQFELAPFYFKKAIQESESEWAQNRQLIDLKKEAKSVRRAIPRGLPYFWVSFTEHPGFAHVIEDQERFPENFAMEILGGLLNLDARRWRKPRREINIIQKVKQFADYWKKYDITK